MKADTFIYIRVVYPCLYYSLLAIHDIGLEEFDLEVDGCIHRSGDFMTITKEVEHIEVVSELVESLNQFTTTEEAKIKELYLLVVHEVISCSVEHHCWSRSEFVLDFTLA